MKKIIIFIFMVLP